MRKRTGSVRCALVGALALLAVDSAPVVGQATSAAARPNAWKQLRTAWGDPDLQGVWNNATATPLEQMTRQEIELSRRAGEAVRRATEGTAVGWTDSGPPSGTPSLVVDPPDGRLRMTPAGVDRLVAREHARRGRGEADSWVDRNMWERCISRGMPTAMIPAPYASYYQIFQTKDTVAISIELIHDVRIIPMDGRPHVAPNIRTWMGDSRGHWEGDTLVVDTTNVNDQQDGGSLQPSHVPMMGYRGSGKTMHLVERFRRVSADEIDYRFTVEDPETFAAPYTVAIPMRRLNPEPRIFEYACHEGNHFIVNALKGARANEQGAIDAAEMVRRQRIDGGHPGIREPAVPIVPTERQ
jgi:hypothetical protein